MAREILIIGGGLSGALTAIHLLRRGERADRITVVDPNPVPGRGVAYGTRNPVHLLNVPAMGMTVDPDEPDDFANWLAVHLDREASEVRTSFAPRMVYAEYVGQRLDEAIAGSVGEF